MIILIPPTLQSPIALSPKKFQARCEELSKAKDWKGLESCSRSQIAARPKDASAFATLAYALLSQNQILEGRAACEEAIQRDPTLNDPYIYLGVSYAQAGDQKDVIAIGQRLAQADPYGAGAYYRIPALFRAAVGDTNLDILPDAEPLFSSIRGAYYQRVDGAAVFDLTIGQDGKPVDVKPLAGPEKLIAAGTMTVRHFLYKPLIKAGKPVSFHAPGVLVVRIRP